MSEEMRATFDRIENNLPTWLFGVYVYLLFVAIPCFAFVVALYWTTS